MVRPPSPTENELQLEAVAGGAVDWSLGWDRTNLGLGRCRGEHQRGLGSMTAPKQPSDKQTAKAARAVQRAINKDNLAKEPPTVGKPVIIDPPDDSRPAIDDPANNRKRRTPS